MISVFVRVKVLFALEFGKIVESDFVYTLASTNIDQSTPNLVKMYVTLTLYSIDTNFDVSTLDSF